MPENCCQKDGCIVGDDRGDRERIAEGEWLDALRAVQAAVAAGAVYEEIAKLQRIQHSKWLLWEKERERLSGS